MRSFAHIIAVVLLLAGCGDDLVIARLIGHQNEVGKNTAGDVWTAASDGDGFKCEQGVRTGADAWARLELGRGGRFRLKESTLVRFACSKQRPGLHVEFGESELEAVPEGTELVLDVGVVRMSAGGRYRLSARDGRSRFVVIVGKAVVDSLDDSGEPAELSAGQGLELVFGTAVVQPIEAGHMETDKSGEAGGTAASNQTPDAGAAAVPGSGADPADPIIAPITATITGKRAQMRAPGQSSWQRLAPGEQPLEAGAALRLGGKSKAAIRRGAEQATVDGPAEVVVGVKTGDLIEAVRGRAVVHATSKEVRIRVPGGVLVARRGAGAGTRARVQIDPRQTEITPTSGTAELIADSGARERLTIGERATITAKGAIEIFERPPARADLDLPAGESATLHDPAPPVVVAIRFAELCSGEGVVETTRRPRFSGELRLTKGTGKANIEIGTGTTRYRVRCLIDGEIADEVRASGKLIVLEDSGSRQLAQRPPSNLVDADGRRYTVLYQNRLPEITFRWPKAQGKGPYTLLVAPAGGSARGQATSYDSPTPSYQLRAGGLSEGVYEYHFTGNGERSRTSTLRIEFDNAAPSAYLAAPAVNQTWSGDSLAVEGAALTGWQVSIGGARVDLDRQGRFSANLPLPIAEGAIAVRLSRSSRGIHYYIRRNKNDR